MCCAGERDGEPCGDVDGTEVPRARGHSCAPELHAWVRVRVHPNLRKRGAGCWLLAGGDWRLATGRRGRARWRNSSSSKQAAVARGRRRVRRMGRLYDTTVLGAATPRGECALTRDSYRTRRKT